MLEALAIVFLVAVVAFFAGALVEHYTVRRDISFHLRKFRDELNHPNQQLKTIMENQAELQAALDAANAQLTKIETEQRERAEAQTELIDALLKEVASLQEALAAGGPLTEGVKTSFAALTANLQRFDDTLPDAPAAPLA